MKLIVFAVVIVGVISCGKFSYSPYVAQTKVLNLNLKNISRLDYNQLSSQGEYKIAVISDTHDYYDELDSQVRYINKQNYDMTFISGDMTNTGLVTEYEESIKRINKLSKPVFTTSGNHDLLIDGAKIYEDYFGPQNYSLEIGDTSFIFLNNNNWESNMQAPNISWLESELMKAFGNRIVVIAHCPYDDQERFTLAQRGDFKNLLETYNVNYFINGHNHNPSESDSANFKHITVGSSSKKVVLELKITDDEITHKSIQI